MRNRLVVAILLTLTLIAMATLLVAGAIIWGISEGDKLVDIDNSVSQQQNKETADSKTGEWKMYQNKEVGISFQYPNIFKRVNVQVVNGDTGRIFTGVLEFAPNHWISFGGVTTDYSKAQGGSILDTYGYEKQENKYVVKFAWGENQVVPSEFWPMNDGKGQAIVVRNTEIGQILSRESVAVFLNIPNSLFRGIVFEIHPLLSGESVNEKEIEILHEIVSSITFDL